MIETEKNNQQLRLIVTGFNDIALLKEVLGFVDLEKLNTKQRFFLDTFYSELKEVLES